MVMGRWSDPSAVCVYQFVDRRRSGCTSVMSGELVVSPRILVGLSSFTTPKSESLIWSARSSPLRSAVRFEFQSVW